MRRSEPNYCNMCGKEFYRGFPKGKRPKKVHCSRSCYANYMRSALLGEANPNFGKRWPEETRKKASEAKKKQFECPDMRWRVGVSNRGKKFSQQRRDNIAAGHRGLKFGPVSDERKREIGRHSRAKFTDEYKARMKQVMVERGYWTPDELKDPWIVYRDKANWICRMWDLFTDHETVQKMRDNGVAGLASYSMCRDHRFSRKSGFNTGVFPEILRHPENCAILSRGDNARKALCKSIPSDSISLDGLFDAILSGDRFSWSEHLLCVDLIYRYKNGERYEGGKYVRD